MLFLVFFFFYFFSGSRPAIAGGDGALSPQPTKIMAALRVRLLTEHAKLPVRGSAFAAGYDLCAAYAGVVPKRGKALLKTDIAIAVPPGTYGRVAPRSGLALKNGIDVGAGVIGSQPTCCMRAVSSYFFFPPNHANKKDTTIFRPYFYQTRTIEAT